MYRPAPKQVLSRRAVLGGAMALPVLSSPLIAQTGTRRVLHVDSYHRGNEWNDRIAAAFVSALEAEGVEVRVLHMDTKRRSSEAEMTGAAAEAARVIADWQPDVVTVSDDNAVKYLLMPHFRDADVPFVFCGLNWDAGIYGLPYANATGMVEVSPIPQILRLLRAHAKGDRIGYLAEDTPTKRKEQAFHEKLFGVDYARTWLVSSYAGWAEAFEAAQGEVDMLMLLGVGALTDWDAPAARQLAETRTRIPTGTDFEWLMPYALLGVGKLPEEQGEWAAQAALRILDGVSPSEIPLAHNTKGQLLFNPRIARRLGIEEAPALARMVE
ncbi:ABC transporter substrate-binding protein [Marinibacterium profundimaris]|uniref:ABC transporter substrate-binding protein n=1 Tax=Marinibacterium profundimaris TaxID=1679460 RepID=A0A225NNF0_9RHOB|nr:ABC transporter substrate-binding protein [Marinibacterium profundimaris]OWU75892.1 hypothetical protein ATO3_06830 [Marinibacterium profundimaris]